MDLTAGERSRVLTPVGLDIGAVTAQEIALSIMAQVVQAVRRGDLRPPSKEPSTRLVEAVDPVCGMTVVVGPDTPHQVVGGRDIWFCSTACRDRYAA